VAGVLDFIVAAGIFWRPTRKACYVYMVAWGFLTAFARLYTNYTGWAFVGPFLARWLWEFLVRTPHWGLPWVLFKTLLRKRVHNLPHLPFRRLFKADKQTKLN
ncbi:MAG: hypothetical protein ACOCZ8_05125, partial [Bacteroidota bacterium]